MRGTVPLVLNLLVGRDLTRSRPTRGQFRALFKCLNRVRRLLSGARADCPTIPGAVKAKNHCVKNIST